MSESAMWDYLRGKFKGLVGAERITERLNDGVPDVVYQFETGEAGWLELKYLRPHVVHPMCRIPWKSAAQPFWLQRWVRWGGRSGVLLRVEGVGWYYWRPGIDIAWIAMIQGVIPIESATWCSGPKLDVDGVLSAMRAD